MTLRQLVDGRLNTSKLFMVEDIGRLIEEVTFTLAHLQEQGVTYRDMHAEHIFYDNGSFKLLPCELIEVGSYQRLKEDGQGYPSP